MNESYSPQDKDSTLTVLTLWQLRSFPVILPAYASAQLHYAEYSCYVAAIVRWFDGQLHYTHLPRTS